MRVSGLTAALLGGALAIAPGCAESHLRAEDGAVASTGVTAPCAASSTGGVSRDCGWRVEDARTCTPGTAVRVACSSACGLGSCTEDAMIRVCAGSTDCRSASALAQNDDACGTLCPQVMLTCPPRGVYTILTAPFSPTRSYTCSIATSP